MFALSINFNIYCTLLESIAVDVLLCTVVILYQSSAAYVFILE